MASLAIPRIVVAATSSGVGKTTVTVGLIGALRRRGLKVAPFKCGPDYLDPTYHERAAGRRSHNLDGWMMGRVGVLATFTRAARGCDIAVIEGMMGLYDGAAPTSDEGSSAELAKCLDAPVLLVADCGGLARTVGAVALGFARFDPGVRLAGMVCNRIGGRGHLDLLREVRPVIPLVGGLPGQPEASFPERHLGLFSATETEVPVRMIEAWAGLVEEWCDLDTILRLAASASPLDEAALIRGHAASPRCSIGIAWDEAFHFYYEDNLRRLEEAGAELVRFSPVHDREVPDVDGLYLGGGYPEGAAAALADNRSMARSIREFHGPIYAECGGLMYLADGIRTLDGVTHPMAGLIPATAVMHDRLQALGYATVTTSADSFLGPAGSSWRGHQFRYSTLEPGLPPAVGQIYRVSPRWAGEAFDEGFRLGDLIASYVHSHWASNPAVPASFVNACAAIRSKRPAVLN